MKYLLLLLNIPLPFVCAQTVVSLSPSQKSALASAENAYRKSMASDPGWSSVNSVVSSELALRSLSLTSGPIHQTVLNSIFSERPDVQSYYVSLASLQASLLDSITGTAGASSSLSIASSTSSSATSSIVSSSPTSTLSLITPSATNPATSPTPNIAEARVAGLGLVGYAAVVGMIGAGAVLL